MTLSSLAEASGVGKSTIGNYENGKTEASKKSLKKLADILKVSVEDLSEVLPSNNAAPPESAAEKLIVREPSAPYASTAPPPDIMPGDLSDIPDVVIMAAVDDAGRKLQAATTPLDRYNAACIATMYFSEIKNRSLNQMIETKCTNHSKCNYAQACQPNAKKNSEDI